MPINCGIDFSEKIHNRDVYNECISTAAPFALHLIGLQMFEHIGKQLHHKQGKVHQIAAIVSPN